MMEGKGPAPLREVEPDGGDAPPDFAERETVLAARIAEPRHTSALLAELARLIPMEKHGVRAVAGRE